MTQMTQDKITNKPKLSQVFEGIVSSDKMKDTVTVSIKRYERHPKYHKYILKKIKLLAHDPGNTKKIGDKVTIASCRPISKRKAFKVINK